MIFILCAETENMLIQKEKTFKNHRQKTIFTTMKLVVNLMLPLQVLHNTGHSICKESETSIINNKDKTVSDCFTTFKIFKQNILSVSCCQRGKSSLTLVNNKVKVVNSCIKSTWIQITLFKKDLYLGDFSSTSLVIITGILLLLQG